MRYDALEMCHACIQLCEKKADGFNPCRMGGGLQIENLNVNDLKKKKKKPMQGLSEIGWGMCIKKKKTSNEISIHLNAELLKFIYFTIG